MKGSRYNTLKDVNNKIMHVSMGTTSKIALLKIKKRPMTSDQPKSK